MASCQIDGLSHSIPHYLQIFRMAHRTSRNTGTKITANNRYFIIYPLDVLFQILYIEGAGVRPRTLGRYQFSNFRIAAVIRPEIVPARMSARRSSILLGCAVGCCLRRFFFATVSTSFLIYIIRLLAQVCKTEYYTNFYPHFCTFCLLAQ